jgi:diguanylate cyclase (GGDEF)-like protein
MARILIVDNPEANGGDLRALLRARGHAVVTASAGREALEVLTGAPCDLVICDIFLAEMDGAEFVRRLRRRPSLKGVPVVFNAPAYREREASLLARACGAACVVSRAGERETALAAIEQVLLGGDGRSAKRAPGTSVAEERPASGEEKRSCVASRLEPLLARSVEFASERDPHRLLERLLWAARDLAAAGLAMVAVGPVAGPLGDVLVGGLEEPLTSQAIAALRREDPFRRVFAVPAPLRLLAPPAAFCGLLRVPSLLVAAIHSPHRVHGWICLGRKLGLSAFSEEDEEIIARLGLVAGEAYERCRLYGEAKEEIARLKRALAGEKEALSRRAVEAAVLGVLASAKSTAEMAAPLLEGLCRPLGFVLGEIWEVDPAAGALRRFGAWHEAEDGLRELAGFSRGRVLARGEGMAGRAWAQGALISSADPSREEPRAEPLRRAGLRVLVAFPIGREGEISGVIGLFGRGPPPDPSTLSFLASQGARLGRIIERRREEKQEERLVAMRLVLRGVHVFMLRQSGREELFREVCRLIIEVGGFAMAAFGLFENGSGDLHPAAGACLSKGEGSERAFSLLAGAAEVARAIEKRRIVCNNAFLPAGEGSFPHPGSLAAVPLFAAANPKGVFVLLAAEGGFFGAEERILVGALGNEVSVVLDQIEKAERLAELALHDPLTGLANRTLYEERLDESLRAAAKSGSRVAVVVFGVRQSRLIDQTLERPARDRLWCEIASRLGATMADPANLARIAEDRFASFRYGIGELSEVAQRMERRLRYVAGKPFLIGKEPFELSLGGGVAIYPSDGRDGDTLLRNAEAALRRAWASGEGYLFYEPSQNAKVAETLRLGSRLQRALGAGEFVLHYQPKVDLDSAAITGAEALIRWQDPENGLVPPLEFVPLLEESGMIAEVGLWVIREAFAVQRRWRAAGLKALRVAVNVSAVQLARRDFVERVSAIAREYRQRATARVGALGIELTESVIMENVEEGIETVNLLRDMDIEIAIDDFGTGYSSLSYLAHLPVNAVKIDRSFIRALGRESTGKSIVAATISLAHSLGLTAIAEGVETVEQAASLAALGCDEIQGYLISPPLPAEDFASFLARGRVEPVWRQIS